jgi:MFS family permease
MILAKSKFMLFICKHHSNGHGKEPEMVTSERRKWLALALLSAVQFMVVLDIAVVNVALPSIQVDLGFSQENLQWVISAYALVFGGLLLLGGRAADLLGRRRIFLAGVVVFTAASLLAGLAWSEPSLIGARALQGLGAAVISPAATSRSACGGRSAASVPRPASCSVACSPTP